MKIEQLLVQHFYNTRQVTLQGMGSFTLSPDFVLPAENDKEVVMPGNAISFQYNPKATEDEALINFIVQQTRKIKPLASADLDSYLVLGKQFLNIGKPFKIDGLGILEKNMQGEYQFLQGNYSTSRMEAAPAELKEKAEDDDISFAAVRHQKGGMSKKALLAASGIILIALAVWAVWYFIHSKKDNPPVVKTDSVQTVKAPPPVDTLKTVAPVKGSVAARPVTPQNADGYIFKVVFKVTDNKAAAEEKMKNLTARGHHVIMYTTDSITYKLAEPFRNPASDTARIKDSLNKYFYLGKAFIEMY